MSVNPSPSGTGPVPDDGPSRSPSVDPTRLDQSARRAAAALLVIVGAVVAVIVFWPGPPDPGGQSALVVFLRRQHRHGLPSWITFNVIQNLANVVMFLPVGYLGALALRRHNYLVVIAAAMASGGIELTQLVFLPHRVASLEDVAANATGALIGLVLALPVLRRRRKRRQQFLRGHRGAVDSDRRTARAARI